MYPWQLPLPSFSPFTPSTLPPSLPPSLPLSLPPSLPPSVQGRGGGCSVRLCQFRCECGGCSEAAEYLYCHRVLLTSSHACGGHAHVRTYHMACDCASVMYMYMCTDMQCTCVLCHYSALCIGPTASCPSGGRAPGPRLGALLCCVQGCVLVYAHCTPPPAPPCAPLPPSGGRALCQCNVHVYRHAVYVCTCD